MGTRRVLTDEMWTELEPLLPDRTPRRGGRWRDHREVVEAIIWRFRTGSPWRDLPTDFPPFQTVWERFDTWAQNGVWDEMLRRLQGQAHAVGELKWTVAVDSTVARAHQHSAGARKDSVQVAPTEQPTERPVERLTGGWIELQEFSARAR